mgnify:CR=1 FL=1
MLPDDLSRHEFGIPVKGKESAKFGTLGFATMQTVPNNVRAWGCARDLAILGPLASLPLRLP